jgi:hypothetical protein
MICQGQDIGNRHKTKLSRNCLGGTILKVEASSLLCSLAEYFQYMRFFEL